MQTQVLFEHPLNEKMRTWLRIEFLIQQLTVNLPSLTTLARCISSVMSVNYWMFSSAAKSALSC